MALKPRVIRLALHPVGANRNFTLLDTPMTSIHKLPNQS